VQIGHRQVREQTVGRSELLAGLAREARDHIDPDAGIREALVRGADTVRILRCGVAPPHAAQDAVAAALQWDMKMPAHLRVIRHERQDPVGEQVRFDGADADAVQVRDRHEFLQQRQEAGSGLTSVVADVHAGEDDLLVSTGHQSTRLREAFGNRLAPARATGQGDGTERAGVVASVLDLEEGSRVSGVTADRPETPGGKGQFLRAAFRRRGAGIDSAVRSGQNRIRPYLQNLLAFFRTQAPGHQKTGLRAPSREPFQGAEAPRRGSGGDGAEMKGDQIRFLGNVRFPIGALEKPLPETLPVVLVDLAAE